MAAPFALGCSGIGEAVTNAVIIGLVVAGIAWNRTARPDSHPGWSWTNAVLGIWLLFAPFVLGCSETTEAVANDLVVGAIVLILGATSAIAGQRLHQSGQAH